MSFYLSILALNSSPINTGKDMNNRKTFSCNFFAKARAVVLTLEEEILERLNSAGLATFSTGPTVGDTFIGTNAIIPTGDGPFIEIIDTGGSAPERSHSDQVLENLSFQIFLRGLDFDATRLRAKQIIVELHGITNTTLTA